MSEVKFTAEFEGKTYDLGTVEVPDSIQRDTLVAAGLARGVEKETRKSWTGVGGDGHPVPVG